MAFVYWIHLPEHTNMLSEGYIGFTSKTVLERWKGHLKESHRKRCPNYPLYNAIKKYEDRLIVSTLAEGCDQYCLDLENKLRPSVKIGWNLQIGGGSGSSPALFSEEARQKISAAGKLRKMSPETKAKLISANTGKRRSDEVRAKLSIFRKGKKKDPSVIAKHKDTLKNEPWRAQAANKDVWAKADSLYSLFLTNIKMGTVTLSKLSEINKDSLTTILKRFRNGWVPHVDPYWIKFSHTYKEAYESSHSTQAVI